MDVKKLIERLRTESLYKDKATLEIMDLCMEAADAISKLQAENTQLLAELEQAKRERNVAYKLLGGEPPKTCKTCVLWGGETDGHSTKLGTVKEMTTRMGRMIFVPGIAGRRRRDERWPSKIIHPGWTCTRAWERYRVHSPNTEPVKS